MHVSKKWKEPAVQVYYEELTLQARQIHKIKKLFEDNLSNQDDYFSKLHWTKALKIRHDETSELNWGLPKGKDGEGEKCTDLEARCKMQV